MNSKRLLALCAFVLFAGTFLVPVGSAAITRTMAINTASAEPMVAFRNFDGNPPLAFDFNGDGRKEIVAQNDNQYAYVFDSATGEILAQLKTTFPAGWGARTFNGPEAYTQDGVSRLVLANSAAYITSYRFDPGLSTPTAFKFVKEWERRLNDCNSNPGMDAKPTLGDVDGDGTMEIFGATEEQGLIALRWNGALYWKKCINGGNAEPVIVELSGDTFPEVVFGSDTGIVHALRGRTGNTYWTFSAHSVYNLGSGSIPVAVGVGQLDGIGGPDVVFGARDSHDANDFSKNHAALIALDHAGKKLWSFRDPTGNPLTYTRPIITDAADDGGTEVYWADWNTMGHKPPFDPERAWEPTGPAHFYKFDASGNMVWRQTIGTWWQNKDVPLADVDGDGVQEMLVDGPSTSGTPGFWVLNTATGFREQHLSLSPWKMSRAPIAVDLAGTGLMQLVIQGGQHASGAGGAAVMVYETGKPLNTKWPHPPGPYIGVQAPPPTGEFEATFRVHSPNPWWQQVSVHPDVARTITDVDVRINGGAWLGMTKQSYGHWTSSHNSPEGSAVEFLAKDSNGAVSKSAVFTWMDGTVTKRSTTSNEPPPPPPFTATFQPLTQDNVWWVEVKVTSSDPIVSVEANINGATDWVMLDKTQWDSQWAKGMNVPAGSQVKFRATSSAGGVAESATYTWG